MLPPKKSLARGCYQSDGDANLMQAHLAAPRGSFKLSSGPGLINAFSVEYVMLICDYI
jgi:hypothetical protein